ncbi:MAG: sortase [Microgenomates group bacterium]
MKKIGNLLIIGGVIIIGLIFFPVLKEEIKYQFKRFSNSSSLISSFFSSSFKEDTIIPLDTDFGIVIPKIGVNAKIFAEVDPTNLNEYLSILKKGVAHSRGSAYPGEVGNVFLFAHSTDVFWNVNRYNAVFFLIGKLEKGDEINIFYQGKKYIYNVVEKKVVSPEILEDYIKNHVSGKTLTLQTCYPPGTTLKRLIVIAKEVN